MNLNNSFVQWLVKRTKGREKREATEILRSLGWRVLGSGCENKTYGKKGVSFVIKISEDPEFCYTNKRERDKNFVQKYKELNLPEHLFVPTKIFDQGSFFITVQARVDKVIFEDKNFPKTYHKQMNYIKRVINKLGIYDVRPENIGLIKNKVVIFDFQV